MIETNNILKGKIASNSSIKGSGISVKGETGNGIEKIEKTKTEELIDYYTIYYTDGTTSVFQISNGKEGKKGDKGDKPIKGVDYFTPAEVQDIQNNILDNVNQFSVEVVETLPIQNIKEHTIYFVPKNTTEQNDIYDEYIYINNSWEHIGTTEVDLSNYYNKSEVDTKVNSTKEEIEKKIKNQRLKLVGKREQATRSGKNAVKELYGRGTHYITFEVDVNKITSSIIFSGILSIDINTASIYIQTSDGNFNIGALTAIANQKFSQSISISNENLNSIKNSTYTPRIQIYSSITDFTDMVYEEMMLRNSNTTDEYEPYGVMPSPEFPSDIRNVGDNINLSKGIKNGLYLSSNGSYSSNDLYVCSNEKIKVKSSSTIVISNEKKKTGIYYIIELDSDGNFIKSQTSNSSVENYMFTIGNNTKYVLIDLGNSSNPCTIENVGNFKVEYNILTHYTAYNCGSIDYKVENADKTESKNIHFPLSKGQLLHEGDYIDSTGIHQKKNTYSIIGNETIVISQSHTNTTLFRITALTNYKSKSTDINGICSHFKFSMVWGYDKEGIYTDGNYIYLSINNNTIGGNTVEKIKTWLAEQYANGTSVTLEYELAEEIVTSLTQEQIEAYYELQKAKYVDKMTLTCLNEIEPTIIDTDKKLEESLLDVEKSTTEIKESKSIINATILKNQSNLSTCKITTTELSEFTLAEPIIVGTKLKFENGKIVIGDNVNHIKVSAQVYFFDGLTAGKKSFNCLKNGKIVIQSGQNVSLAYSGFGFSGNILKVSKDDVISLAVKGAVNDTIYCNRNSTWITIEVID